MKLISIVMAAIISQSDFSEGKHDGDRWKQFYDGLDEKDWGRIVYADCNSDSECESRLPNPDEPLIPGIKNVNLPKQLQPNRACCAKTVFLHVDGSSVT